MEITIHGLATVDGVTVTNGSVRAEEVDEVVPGGQTALEFEPTRTDNSTDKRLTAALALVEHEEVTETMLLDYIAVVVAERAPKIWAEQRGVTKDQVTSHVSTVRSASE